jgi:hypothetical protein
VPAETAIVVAFLVGFPLRVLAIVFRLGMPKFVYGDDLRD